MNSSQTLMLCLCGAFFVAIAVLAVIAGLYSLRGIPNKPVGNGQHGTARFPPTDMPIVPIKFTDKCENTHMDLWRENDPQKLG